MSIKTICSCGPKEKINFKPLGMKMSIYFGPSLLGKAPTQVHKGAIKKGVHGSDLALGKLSRLF